MFYLGQEVKLRKRIAVGSMYGGIAMYSDMKFEEAHKVSRISSDGGYNLYDLEGIQYTYSEQMLMPVLKVNEVVRIRENLVSDEHYGTNGVGIIYCCTSMADYFGETARITRITSEALQEFKVDIDNEQYFWNVDMVDFLSPEEVTEFEGAAPLERPEYEQEFDNDFIVRRKCKVLIPTRKTNGCTLVSSRKVTTAIQQGYDYMVVLSAGANISLVGIDGAECGDYFCNNDLEEYTTSYVQGEIAEGSRVKCACGKTHTYKPSNFVETLDDNDKYTSHKDSSDWYIRVWKGLVRRPRGTIDLTEYKAMCPECYEAFKAKQDKRTAFLNYILAEQIRIEARRQTEAERRRQREEQERLQREERERRRKEKLDNIKKNMWKHHVCKEGISNE